MAGRKRLPAILASSARTLSMSSRNFRNMIHVSIGRRSRSPLRPLSLRMMSRQDLTIEASCCAVDRGNSFFAVFCLAIGPCLCCVEECLQLVDRRSQIVRAAKHLRNVHYTAALRNRRYFQNFRDGELRRAIVYIFIQNIVQNLACLFGILFEERLLL